MINIILQRRNLGTQHLAVEKRTGSRLDLLYDNKSILKDQYTIINKGAEKLTIKDLSLLREPPDCLYTDCEGCLKGFNKTDIGKYVLRNVRFIVNEMDGNNKHLRKVWKKYGFQKVGVGYGCTTNCVTEVWAK